MYQIGNRNNGGLVVKYNPLLTNQTSDHKYKVGPKYISTHCNTGVLRTTNQKPQPITTIRVAV